MSRARPILIIQSIFDLECGRCPLFFGISPIPIPLDGSNPSWNPVGSAVVGQEERMRRIERIQGGVMHADPLLAAGLHSVFERMDGFEVTSGTAHRPVSD